MSLDDAIAGFTVGPAYAAFAEKSRGRIAPGYVADLTVFDRDLASDRSLLETKIVGGKVAHGNLPGAAKSTNMELK